jgi:putative membrane protein
MGEIAAGNLMIQKSSNASVKAFATRMVKDHTYANKKLEEIAKAKGLSFSCSVLCNRRNLSSKCLVADGLVRQTR